MKTKQILARGLLLVSGLFSMALGVSLSVKADLGVTPISCVPYVYSLNTPFTLGELTIFMNCIFILMQIAILRRNYSCIQLIQLPAVVILGFFIDFTLALVSGVNPPTYPGQFLCLLISCAFIALGVFFIVKADVTYIPGDGLIAVVAEVFKKDFGKTKICFDSAMVVIGVTSSLLLMGRLAGIREGTFVAALLVGLLIQLYGKALSLARARFANHGETKKDDGTPPNADAPHLVVTISRECGSGGHEIGRRIAQQLGIPFYDKQLIDITAAKSGFTEQFIKENEQKIAHSLLHELQAQNYAYVNGVLPPTDALFLVQSKIILDICSKESCVIVGRCANFILKDVPGCFNVFIHADKEYRKANILRDGKVAPAFTTKQLEQSDRQRANYCMTYTGRDWKDASGYHLTVDSTHIATEDIARQIIGMIRAVPGLRHLAAERRARCPKRGPKSVTTSNALARGGASTNGR